MQKVAREEQEEEDQVDEDEDEGNEDEEDVDEEPRVEALPRVMESEESDWDAY